MDFETLTLLGYLTVIGGAVYMLQNGSCNRMAEQISSYPIPESMMKRYGGAHESSEETEPVVVEQPEEVEEYDFENDADDESESYMETDSLASQEIEPLPESDDDSEQSHED